MLRVHRSLLTLSVAFLVSLSFGVSWAQELTPDSLSPAQQQEFYRSQLTVRANWQGVAYSDFYGRPVTPVYDRHRWQAFQGLFPIREDEFLAIAGYPDQAGRAQTIKAANESSTIVGGILLVGGAIVAVLGAVHKSEVARADVGDVTVTVQEDDPIKPAIYLGIAASGVGLYMLADGLKQRRTNVLAYEDASKIAEDYNKRLLEQLSDKENR